ncbi:portal protein [Phaeobacter inhibens]|uniref:portal protein n=1 Tax=Phaeobacter inhibens TaxID=221822 RepID=UPI000C9D138A|nr:hypothetical protein [Phaeobacter inhibens]AUQ64439.1 hypothetical protein PhaeoP51_03508 [Phaeobacter inhibens]
MKPTPKNKDDLQRIVSRAAKEAIDYVEQDIAPARIRAAKYFDGKDTLGHEPGRSKVVATKCRDVVRSSKPGLMRVFMATDKPVEFIPNGQDSVDTAEQQTKYAQYVFNRNGGFRLLNDVIDDALRKKVGIAKVYMTEGEKSQIFDFELGPDEFAMMAGADDVEIIEHEKSADGIHRGKAQQVARKPEIRMESMPPEEFFIDPNARSIDDFYCCGQQRELYVSDLVEMGFDFDEVSELGTEGEPGEEEKEFRQGTRDDDEDSEDPAMRPVLYTEAYMRLDVEGTGVAQLYAFVMAGTNYKLLDHQPVDDTPFAVFEIDPEPHTFFGRSLVELIEQDQDASTALLRGILDSVALGNAPRWAFDERNVNADDMMNGEVAGLVRTDGTPIDKFFPLNTTFPAADALAAAQYHDMVTQNKTGITEAASGLNPDALQNANVDAVNMLDRAAAAQPEVMARHLAEGGMTRLFRLVLRLLRNGEAGPVSMRHNGEFVDLDASQFDPDLDVTINVGLGNEGEAVKVATLSATFERQMGIWNTYGPKNGLVKMTNIRNTLGDMLMLSGLHNVSRYWQPMSENIEMQLEAQAKAEEAEQPPQPDPLVQAEQIKAQASIQKAQQDAQIKIMQAQQKAALDVRSAQQEGQLRMAEIGARDDLARDQMILDGVLRAADLLGKHGVAVDLNSIYQMQQQNGGNV